MATFIDSTGGKAIVDGIAKQVKTGYVPLNTDKKIDSKYLPATSNNITYIGYNFGCVDYSWMPANAVVSNVTLVTIPSGYPDQGGSFDDLVCGVVWDTSRKQFLLYATTTPGDTSYDSLEGYFTYDQAASITLARPDTDSGMPTKATPVGEHIYIDNIAGTILVSNGDGDDLIGSSGLSLGETATTAYAGSKGKQNATNIAALQTAVAGKSATSHTHSVKINGVTKTIAASGGTAVDLGTYVTSTDVVPTTTITTWVASAFS